MRMVEEEAASAELAQLEDAELLANPDPDAFAEFYRRHARKLAGYLMRATRNAESPPT